MGHQGKALNVPVYQLLGGASRDGVLVYGHASGRDIEETVKAVADYLNLIQSDSRAKRHSRVGKRIRSWPRQNVLRAGGKDAPPENV